MNSVKSISRHCKSKLRMQIPPVTGSHQTQAGIEHRQPPDTDSHRSQVAAGYRQPLTRT